jgi:hypothetical protein
MKSVPQALRGFQLLQKLPVKADLFAVWVILTKTAKGQFLPRAVVVKPY